MTSEFQADTAIAEPEAEVPLIGTIESFRKKHYPHTTNIQWNDWKWQLSNSIKSISEVKKFINLTEDENIDNTKLPMRITPYYLSLICNSKELRKTMIPTVNELKVSFGEKQDPLSEEKDSPLPGLVHRYPDRVLFLVTDICSNYCRYCTRSRIVGRHEKEVNYEEILNYIRKHTEIRDVILSGGDPLTLSDSTLEYLLKSLRDIPHVEIIRIGTKVPFVLPQRITDNLVNMLKKNR